VCPSAGFDRVTSVRLFLICWLGTVIGIIGYAVWDRPNVAHENGFSVHLEWTRASELLHWAGRLLNADAIGLLLLNALCVGGIIALLVVWVIEHAQRRKSKEGKNDRGPDDRTRVTRTIRER
jgi:hypothetical protein